MNPTDQQIKEFAWEKWAEMKEYILSHHDNIPVGHYPGNHEQGGPIMPMPRISYPFIHTLIKGLDKDEKLKYYKNLADIIAQTFGSTPGIWLLKSIQLEDITVDLWGDIQTAELDQILLAFWKVFNE